VWTHRWFYPSFLELLLTNDIFDDLLLVFGLRERYLVELSGFFFTTAYFATFCLTSRNVLPFIYLLSILLISFSFPYESFVFLSSHFLVSTFSMLFAYLLLMLIFPLFWSIFYLFLQTLFLRAILLAVIRSLLRRLSVLASLFCSELFWLSTLILLFLAKLRLSLLRLFALSLSMILNYNSYWLQSNYYLNL